MAFAFKYFKLDFNDYIETSKINFFRKKILRLEFQILGRLMKKIRLNLDIRFMVKFNRKTLKYYLKNNFLNM